MTSICDQILPGGFTCVPILVSVPTGSELAVYEETNACDGLQTEEIDCDDDGEAEEADELVAGYADGSIRPSPLA